MFHRIAYSGGFDTRVKEVHADNNMLFSLHPTVILWWIFLQVLCQTPQIDQLLCAFLAQLHIQSEIFFPTQWRLYLPGCSRALVPWLTCN